ncbi:MAG TPA: decaprenyl-phosphate phosphoribosyltransferase [Cytophagales bacterium]|nr:decaprenyl-phosphate phosphoribosyltransferase [Cytophagales bacterium]
MLQFIKLIRVHHWVKNGFLFIPVFFAGELFNLHNILLLLGGFIAFSLTASSIYILNDYRDIESDRQHPTKSKRPLASGAISTKVALPIAVLFLIGGLGLAYFIDLRFFVLVIIYFLLNLGYSMGLKNVSILDILILSSGFLLRTIAGGFIVDVFISQWLVIMIFLLALFLAIAKRRDDILIYMESGKMMRKSIQFYNIEFVNLCITMISGVIIVAYLMYTISQEVTMRFQNDHVYYTAVFVIAGVMRYMQITYVEKESGNPTKILYKDRFIQLTLLGWILCFFAIIYLGKF